MVYVILLAIDNIAEVIIFSHSMINELFLILYNFVDRTIFSF